MADSILSGAAEFFSRGLDRGIRQKEVATQNKIEQAREAQQKQYQDAMLQQGAARLAQDKVESDKKLDYDWTKLWSDNIIKEGQLGINQQKADETTDMHKQRMAFQYKKLGINANEQQSKDLQALYEKLRSGYATDEEAMLVAKEQYNLSHPDSRVGDDGKPSFEDRLKVILSPSEELRARGLMSKPASDDSKDGATIGLKHAEAAVIKVTLKSKGESDRANIALKKAETTYKNLENKNFQRDHDDTHELQQARVSMEKAALHHVNAETSRIEHEVTKERLAAQSNLGMSVEQLKQKVASGGKSDVVKDRDHLQQELSKMRAELSAGEKTAQEDIRFINSDGFINEMVSANDVYDQAMKPGVDKKAAQFSDGKNFLDYKKAIDWHDALAAKQKLFQDRINGQAMINSTLRNQIIEVERMHNKILAGLGEVQQGDAGGTNTDTTDSHKADVPLAPVKVNGKTSGPLRGFDGDGKHKLRAKTPVVPKKGSITVNGKKVTYEEVHP